MSTNAALITTSTQVETILTDHSVTYTTTDNRGEAEADYRIAVGDATATYWDGYWEVEDAHTAIEVDTDGDWGVTRSDVDGIILRYNGALATITDAGEVISSDPIARLDAHCTYYPEIYGLHDEAASR